MADVLANGSLPVPAHLRSSGAGRRKYRYPHDFAGDDIEQQYLPDKLVGRRYYFPGDLGAEVKIGERMARIAESRQGRPHRKEPVPGAPRTDPMAAGSEGMRRRRESLKDLADEQRRDAGE
jgi:hypothetical protein